MDHFIGMKLSDVTNELEKNGISYYILDNNHNVNGDTTLVTNVKIEDKTVKLTVGKFIFNLEDDIDA